MSYLENVFLGVVSGVLTSAGLFLVGWFFTRVFTPWFRSARYQGVDVSGTWSADVKNGQDEPLSHISLSLNQRAYALSGTLHIINRQPKNPYELTFEVSGRLWDSYVSISMTPVDRRVTSIATALFRVGGGGVNLQGAFAMRDTVSEGVQSTNLHLVRKAIAGGA